MTDRSIDDGMEFIPSCPCPGQDDHAIHNHCYVGCEIRSFRLRQSADLDSPVDDTPHVMPVAIIGFTQIIEEFSVRQL
ncbi:MAG: hypothetical protein AAGE90_03330 [Pseudomonadota bacterium]